MSSESVNKRAASHRKPKPKRKVGRPTKSTPKLLQAIVEDIARGLTREQACAVNGVHRHSLENWEKRPEYVDLRAKTEAARIKDMLSRIEACEAGKGDWKRFRLSR